MAVKHLSMLTFCRTRSNWEAWLNRRQRVPVFSRLHEPCGDLVRIRRSVAG